MTYTGSSCEDIYNNNLETSGKSGYYRINDNQWVYCSMTAIANGTFISTCAGVGGGWRRIVNINISAGDDCPGEWRKATQSGVNFCRVASDEGFTCSSSNFSTNGISYQRVCGRARGYQKGDTGGLYSGHFRISIDSGYVSGSSIIYSNNPRQHIWTYASGRGTGHYGNLTCPSTNSTSSGPPPYVSNNYYCKAGSWYCCTSTMYLNNTLWDGAGCVDNCCDDTTQPWFYHQLNQTILEARICAYGSYSERSTLIDQLELYIQ